ncbi:VC0807 family protein [Desulfosporosinus sp. SB140]|uniref:VC0807 family protein n=1 Tax=Desulfosporosinus paludis TaxID=3115649 RepID=UPI00388E44AF
MRISQSEGMNLQVGALQRKLGLSLIFSWLVPWVLYMVLRPYLFSDTIALTIVGVIPLIRTVALFVWRRRVDWISVGGVISFTIGLTFSLLLGGSSLPFKLYRPIVTGTIGLACLISAAIKKPLLSTLIKLFIPKASEGFGHSMSDQRFSLKQMAIITTVAGLVLLADAVVHIIMAISLPTDIFLLMSRVVTIVAVAVLFGSRWLVRRNIFGNQNRQ